MKFANSVSDNRRKNVGHFKHSMPDIIVLCVLARLCRCVTRSEIIAFANKNLRKFQAMKLLRNGVPSEPTLCRIFKQINGNQMAELLNLFTTEFLNDFQKFGFKVDVLAMDGKCMNGTLMSNGRTPDNVSLLSTNFNVTLATEMCEEKSNELAPAQVLLDKVDISNAIITGDAMFCQKAIVDKIRKKGGEFVLQVKANQKALRWGLEDNLKFSKPYDTYCSEPTLAHGRIETRICKVYQDDALIADKKKWGGELVVIEVFNNIITKKNNKITMDKRIYISSVKKSAKELSEITQKHWLSEINHWHLDVNFKQDRIKRKYTNSARNLDTIQRLCCTLLSAWRLLRKKRKDKCLGNAKLMLKLSNNSKFSLDFLSQN